MELPEPLTPAELDIRDFSDLPIDAGRVLSSRFVSTVDPAAGFFSMQLWFASWGRVPAASLPNDDRQLCHLCGLGRDLKTWESIKQDALYGWKLCSDGNYYHPVIAEKALVAWIEKLHQRIKSGRGNASRWGCAFSEERELIEKFHVAWGMLKSNNPNSKLILKGNPLENTKDNTKNPTGIPSGIPQDIPDQSQGKVREGKVREDIEDNPYSPQEPEDKPKKEKSASAKAIAECVENAFVKLWDGMCLPKVNKTQAARAWKTVCKGKSELEINNGVLKVLAHMAKVKAYVGDRESPFMKTHLATYLNNRKWEERDMPIIINAPRNTQETRAEVAASNAAKAYEKLFGEKLPSHANCIEGELA